MTFPLTAWLSLSLVLGAPAQVPPPPEGAPVTPALRRLLDDGGTVERVATNFAFADGPVWVDGALVFTDTPRAQVLRWRAGEAPTVIQEDSGGASGLALDANRRLIAAERERHRITRREDGEVAVLLDAIDGRPLAAPTDIAAAPDGSTFIVDASSATARPARPGRLIRIGADGAAVVVASDLVRPAGVAVARDGSEVYVSDASRRELRAYRLNGASPAFKVLASIVPWKRGVQGRPDGLTLDAAGRIYLAGPGGIWVLDRNGGRLGVIATPETPSACAFGDADGRTLYITAETSLYKVRLTVSGAK